MVKKHLIRLNAPKTWPIKRKGLMFITRPNPGSHNLKTSMPTGVVLKEMLKHVKTTKEVKRILNSKGFIVNKKARVNPKYPVGLMDTIEIPAIKENYRALISRKGKLIFHSIKEAETAIKPCKIVGKRTLKNKKLQLNLNDGTNILVKKDEYKVGDTIVLDLKKKEIKQHIKFEKGALVYMTSGKMVATIGNVESVKSFKGKQPDSLIFKTKDGNILETKKEYAIVIGKDKPTITLPEK
jgi:small subunit ribosomal protein S4e